MICIIIRKYVGLKKNKFKKKKQAVMCNLQILPPVFPFQFASTSFKL